MEARGNDRPTGQSLNSEINIAPLVDVMLVVLIIFIVVTPLLQRSVAVDLPHARNVADISEDPARALTVVLQGNGQVFLGSDPIARVELDDALWSRHLADPALQLQVKADHGVAYGEIKRILQAGRAAGFRGASLIARASQPADCEAGAVLPPRAGSPAAAYGD